MKKILILIIVFSGLMVGCQNKTEEERMIEMGDKIENVGWAKPTKEISDKSIYIKYKVDDKLSIEIRIYKPNCDSSCDSSTKYTAASIAYEREMDTKDKMLYVGHFYDHLFQRNEGINGMSFSINSDELCYFYPDNENDTSCSEEEVQELKKLIDQSEKVLDNVGINEEELIKYVYWKYVPDDEKMDDE